MRTLFRERCRSPHQHIPSEKPRKRWLILLILTILLAPLLSMAQDSELAKRISELAERLAFASKGQVLSVRGNQAYLDMGEQAGVIEGTRLEVVRLGDPLVVGGKVIGHEETIIGEIEIVRVREGIAIAKLLKQEQPFQKGDRAYQIKKKVQRVALAEFPFGDGFNDFTRNVQDLLYTNFIQKGMSVVERQKLEEVLREQKIAYTGIIDLATAAQVGKLLGVEGVVVGSVTDLGNTVALTARLIDVEKGTAVTAARVELAKTTDLGALIAKGGRGMPAKDPAAVISPAVATVTPVSAGAVDQRRVKLLKETAAAVAKKAAKGLQNHHYIEGRSLIVEYNSLVRQAKAVLSTDPFIQVLEVMPAVEGEGGHVMAGKIARFAKELEIYLTSFATKQAIKETAAALAEQSAKGLQNHEYSHGKSLIEEYNILVRQAKTLFKTDHCCPARVRPHRAVDLVKPDAVEDGIKPRAFVGRPG